jgi:predicted dehydrogenase
VLEAIERAKVDAVVGYTQRFRRKWLSAKEKVRSGALGDVTLVTSRAFMNRLVAIDNYKRTDDPKTISPMVISGTHALDIVMWCMEAKTPVECYARSIDKVLGPAYGGIDATAGMIMFADASVYHLNISWALPVTWPGAVYSLEVGINGTHGVLTIDDTHRDMVLAVSAPQEEGYAPDKSRLVDFLGSYPPGDMVLGELRGPMADETVSWLNRVSLGLPTQAATAREAHRNLMLTKALDLSARRKAPVALPLDPKELVTLGAKAHDNTRRQRRTTGGCHDHHRQNARRLLAAALTCRRRAQAQGAYPNNDPHRRAVRARWCLRPRGSEARSKPSVSRSSSRTAPAPPATSAWTWRPGPRPTATRSTSGMWAPSPSTPACSPTSPSSPRKTSSPCRSSPTRRAS